MEFEFVVYGDPKGKARPRFTKTGAVYTPKETKEYEHMVTQAYLDSGGINFGEQPINLLVSAVLRKAKSNKKKSATTKPDLDNIIKAVLDGLNGVAFKDDKQVIDIRAKKRYCTDGEAPVLAVRISSDAE